MEFHSWVGAPYVAREDGHFLAGNAQKALGDASSPTPPSTTPTELETTPTSLKSPFNQEKNPDNQEGLLDTPDRQGMPGLPPPPTPPAGGSSGLGAEGDQHVSKPPGQCEAEGPPGDKLMQPPRQGSLYWKPLGRTGPQKQ